MFIPGIGHVTVVDPDPPETLEEALFALQLAVWDLFQTLRSEFERIFARAIDEVAAIYERAARRFP